MISTALIAYFSELIARCLAQVGFLLQKMAHRDQEKRDSRRRKNNDGNIDNIDNGKGYFQWKWFLGITLIILHSLEQAIILPLIDLTLISTQAVTSILMNMLLSTYVLGETFIW